ncbi:MAG: hypothetical protein WB622_14435 [Acidobacteriaceae bacterium]
MFNIHRLLINKLTEVVQRQSETLVQAHFGFVAPNEWISYCMQRHDVAPYDFDVISNPELLREGPAISDFLHPDRIVVGVGANNEQSAQLLCRIYKPTNERQLLLHQKCSAGRSSRGQAGQRVVGPPI